VLLGRLPPEGLVGGALPLDGARAREALAPLAEGLGLPLPRAAEAVLAVADAQMARAVRTLSVERGHEPAALSLLAFGGAGGLHACALMRELGMREVVVPPAPGLLCAYGALAADAAFDFVDTMWRELPAGEGEVASRFAALERAGEAALDEEGVAADARARARTCAMRYRGQAYDLVIPAAGPLGDAADAGLVEAFHAAHRARYGYVLAQPVELVSLRLRAVGRRPSVPLPSEPPEPGDPVVGRASLFVDGVAAEAPILRRRRLAPGARVLGPALIVEYSATTYLPPGAAARVADARTLRITG
jgi:N-methylhydantoinase A